MATLTTNPSPSTGVSLPVFASAHWPLRFAAAATFLYHGVEKLPALPAGAEMMGFPLWLWTLIALTEVAAGLALVAGGFFRNLIGDLMTRFSGVSIIAIMIGAIWLVHWGQWSFLASDTHPFGGVEFQVLLLATGLFFSARGNAA